MLPILRVLVGTVSYYIHEAYKASLERTCEIWPESLLILVE